MTSDKRRKARIRARMAKTGERYTTARRHLFPDDPQQPIAAGFPLLGGQHPDATALAAVLRHAGVTADDGRPVSEPLLFGIMGGLGAGYILWEFAHDDSRVVTLGFHNQWQYHDRAVLTALDRLGVEWTVHRTSGARTAARQLDAQLAAGRPALVWPDRYTVGYWHLPASLSGHGGHVVVVHGTDGGDGVRIDDRSSAPLTVPRAALDEARDRVVSYKNVLIDPRPVPGPIDHDRLAGAVTEGVDACVAQLRGPSTSFSLPAWRKWARLMTDTRNAKAWPRVFADGAGLTGALLSVWEATSDAGMTGGHLRGLYADFLTQTTALHGMDVDEVVVALRAAARRWADLGDIAAAGAPFTRLRELTATIRHAVAADGDAGADEAAAAARELWKLRAERDASPPLSAAEIDERFGAMGALLSEIHELEVTALEALAHARWDVGGPPPS